jgi:hypothetical protein
MPVPSSWILWGAPGALLPITRPAVRAPFAEGWKDTVTTQKPAGATVPHADESTVKSAAWEPSTETPVTTRSAVPPF